MKIKTKQIFLLAAMTAMLLSACGSGEDPGPSDEDVINQAYTQAAETLQASMALTEAAQPVATNTPFVLNSPTPVTISTNTPLPSPTVLFPTLAPLSSPTNAPPATQPGLIDGRPCLRAEMAWENWPDGSRMSPGESFAKLWRLTNSGYCTWTEQFSAIWVDGVNLAGHGIFYFKDLKDFPDEGIPNGKALDLQISMEAPSTKGHYRSVWKLRDDKANFFGIGSLGNEVFWVDIFVRE